MEKFTVTGQGESDGQTGGSDLIDGVSDPGDTSGSDLGHTPVAVDDLMSDPGDTSG
jgi:hypothetical protein